MTLASTSLISPAFDILFHQKRNWFQVIPSREFNPSLLDQLPVPSQNHRLGETSIMHPPLCLFPAALCSPFRFPGIPSGVQQPNNVPFSSPTLFEKESSRPCLPNSTHLTNTHLPSTPPRPPPPFHRRVYALHPPIHARPPSSRHEGRREVSTFIFFFIFFEFEADLMGQVSFPTSPT